MEQTNKTPKMLIYILERKLSTETMSVLVKQLSKLSSEERELREKQFVELIDKYKTDKEVLRVAREMQLL